MFTLALDRYDHYVSHILTCFYRFLDVFLSVFNLYFIQEYCFNLMDFKISDTNSGKKSLLHNGYSYRIDVVL